MASDKARAELKGDKDGPSVKVKAKNLDRPITVTVRPGAKK